MTRFASLVLLVAPLALGRDALYDLRPGTEWAYEYFNEVSMSHPTFGMTNRTNGRMKCRVIGNFTTNGTTYAQVETRYENIFGVPPQTMFFRQDDKGAHVASVIRDEFRESMLLPANAAVGAEWEYYDGEKGRRRIASIGPQTIGTQTFERCIVVERVFDSPEKNRTWTNTAFYVQGRGEVRMHFIQQLGPTRSETLTTLAVP